MSFLFFTAPPPKWSFCFVWIRSMSLQLPPYLCYTLSVSFGLDRCHYSSLPTSATSCLFRLDHIDVITAPSLPLLRPVCFVWIRSMSLQLPPYLCYVLSVSFGSDRCHYSSLPTSATSCLIRLDQIDVITAPSLPLLRPVCFVWIRSMSLQLPPYLCYVLSDSFGSDRCHYSSLPTSATSCLFRLDQIDVITAPSLPLLRPV